MLPLLLAQTIAAPALPSAAIVPPLKPAAVLQRYATALAKVRGPRVMTFLYTLDQSGARTLAQTHRVYRSGNDERDELLSIDGHPLTTPKVHIFRGRRDRYAIRTLAPRPADYDFAFVGPRRNLHHYDYVFRLSAKRLRPFTITDITLDGVRFLPSTIAFATGPADGSGNVTFGVNGPWWVAYSALARATVGDSVAAEKLSFYTYRFPPALPPSTFGGTRAVPRFGPAIRPGAGGTRAVPTLAPAVPPGAGGTRAVPTFAPAPPPGAGGIPTPHEVPTPRRVRSSATFIHTI